MAAKSSNLALRYNERTDFSQKPIPAHRPTCVCVCRLSLSVNPPSIKLETQFPSTLSLTYTFSLTHKIHVFLWSQKSTLACSVSLSTTLLLFLSSNSQTYKNSISIWCRDSQHKLTHNYTVKRHLLCASSTMDGGTAEQSITSTMEAFVYLWFHFIF